jgi:3-oxoacyl-[acyl-carrier-protein] synthase II
MPRSSASRVVVTGVGPVSSIGIGKAAFLNGLRTGQSGASPISSFDVSGFEHSLGCEVIDFDAGDFLQLPVGEFGRASQFAAVAARMAVEDAEYPIADLETLRTLVCVGTTDGESRDLDELVQAEVSSGWESLDRDVVSRVATSRIAAAVAKELRLEDAEVTMLPTACSAGNYAIGYGLDAVRSGEVKVALCGGADALCRKTFAGFYRLGTIAPDRCQPFDVNRKGILTGEGAGMLLLESLESAARRGAKIYAEVLGYGLNCDADHPVAPNAASIARCIRLAHIDANVAPADIDLISAHGTGTRANDVTECRAIREIFGNNPPPTVSIKSMIGHAMGAASALAAVACALAISEGFIPPTINHVEMDPECGVDCVPNRAAVAKLRVVQNNGLAFGGNNAVVILSRFEPAEAREPCPS